MCGLVVEACPLDPGSLLSGPQRRDPRFSLESQRGRVPQMAGTEQGTLQMGEQGQVFLNKDAASPLLPAAGWPRAQSPGPADSAALPAEAPGGKSRRLQGAGCGPRSLLLGQLTGPCRHRPGPEPLPGPQVPRGREQQEPGVRRRQAAVRPPCLPDSAPVCS